MLGSIVLCLASPRKNWGGVKIFLSTQDVIKHPEMHKKVKVVKLFWREKKKKLPELPRNLIGRGGGVLPRTDRMDDIAE